MSQPPQSNYWRTCDEDGKTSTHLAVYGSDLTICGHDLSGDESVHSKPPIPLKGKYRITCMHCKILIKAVGDHLKV